MIDGVAKIEHVVGARFFALAAQKHFATRQHHRHLQSHVKEGWVCSLRLNNINILTLLVDLLVVLGIELLLCTHHINAQVFQRHNALDKIYIVAWDHFLVNFSVKLNVFVLQI